MTATNHDPIARIEQAYAKLTRAREIAAAGQVSRVLGMDGAYWVASSTAGAGYLVQADQSCTCPDFANRGNAERGSYCKHLLSVRLYTDSQPAPELTEAEAAELLEAQRKEYLAAFEEYDALKLKQWAAEEQEAARETAFMAGETDPELERKINELF